MSLSPLGIGAPEAEGKLCFWLVMESRRCLNMQSGVVCRHFFTISLPQASGQVPTPFTSTLLMMSWFASGPTLRKQGVCGYSTAQCQEDINLESSFSLKI